MQESAERIPHAGLLRQPIPGNPAGGQPQAGGKGVVPFFHLGEGLIDKYPGQGQPGHLAAVPGLPAKSRRRQHQQAQDRRRRPGPQQLLPPDPPLLLRLALLRRHRRLNELHQFRPQIRPPPGQQIPGIGQRLAGAKQQAGPVGRGGGSPQGGLLLQPGAQGQIRPVPFHQRHGVGPVGQQRLMGQAQHRRAIFHGGGHQQTGGRVQHRVGQGAAGVPLRQLGQRQGAGGGLAVRVLPDGDQDAQQPRQGRPHRRLGRRHHLFGPAGDGAIQPANLRIGGETQHSGFVAALPKLVQAIFQQWQIADFGGSILTDHVVQTDPDIVALETQPGLPGGQGDDLGDFRAPRRLQQIDPVAGQG